MRGCLTWFFVLLAVVLVATWAFAPVVAAGLVSAGLGTAGFESADKKVTVIADPPIELLTLRADKVRIQATDATFAGLHIAGGRPHPRRGRPHGPGGGVGRGHADRRPDPDPARLDRHDRARYRSAGRAPTCGRS